MTRNQLCQTRASQLPPEQAKGSGFATLHLTSQIIRVGGIVLDTLANERDHQVQKAAVTSSKI